MAIVVIRGEIDFSIVTRIRAASAGAPTDELLILLNSAGGNVEAGLAAAAAIRQHRGATCARIVRECSSAAILILSACARREARASARFAMHEGAATTWAERPTSAACRRRADQLAALDERCRRAIALGTGCTVGELAALERAGAVLTGREALDLNLIDTLIGCPGLSAAAARRREARAKLRAPVRWNRSDFAALARAGMASRPIGIPPRVLKAILAERRP